MLKSLILATAAVAAIAADATAGAAKPPNAHQAQFQAVHKQIRGLLDECKKNPKAWEPRLQVSEMLVQYGLSSMAIKQLDEAIALKPDHAPLYEVAGKAYFGLKKYDEAIVQWKKARELKPEDMRYVSWIAQAEKMRKDDEALAKLDTTLKDAPGDLDALLARARIRIKREQWEPALLDLTPYLKADPDSVDALGLAALANLKLKRLDAAVLLWERAVKADPDNGANRIRLQKARELKKHTDELNVVRGQLMRDPDNGKLRMRAAELWAQLGKMEYAMVSAREALRLMPKSAEAHRLYGFLLLRTGKMDEAVEAFETCLKLDPKDAAAKGLLEKAKILRATHVPRKKGSTSVPKHGTQH